MKLVKGKLKDGDKIVSRFKGILIKMISGGKDIPKIRQVLLHWSYELK